MAKTKKNLRTHIAEIKAEEARKGSKKNYTFRLPEGLMERFQAACEKEGVAQGKLLEKLIVEAVGGNK